MVTVNTDNIGLPDYPSLAAAIAGEQSTTGVLPIDLSGVAADTTNVDINGMAASELILRSDTGVASGRYTGTEDWSDQHYRLEGETTGKVLRVRNQLVTIEYIQIKGDGDVEILQILDNSSGSVVHGNRFDCRTTQRYVAQIAFYDIARFSANIVVATPNATQQRGVGIFPSFTIDDFANNTFKGFNLGNNRAVLIEGTITDFFNNQFIDNTFDVSFGSPTNGSNNATSKGSGDITAIDILNIATPADYVSATDFRSVDGGKLDLDGSAANLPATDITGAAFSNANVSPFNEIFGAGPAPAGYSYGYFVG